MLGSYKASSLTDGLQRRDQLLGYIDQADGDEPAIPIVIDGESRVNGLYKVMGVGLSTDEFTRKQGNLSYTLSLEPVFGFANPMFESIITGALAKNVIAPVPAAVDAYSLHAVPATAFEYNYTPLGTFSYAGRVSADGNLSVIVGPGILSGLIQFYCAPASYYVGAATFEQGTTLLPVVGRQMVQTDTVNWRLSNGLLRVTPSGGKLDLSWYNGSTWSSLKRFYFYGPTHLSLTSINTVTVLRNSPEEVAIRLGMQGAGGLIYGRVYLDLHLRRGERMVRGYLTSDTTDTWSLRRDTVEACSAITYVGSVTFNAGMKATAADADLNGFTMHSILAATTQDLANGFLTLTATGTTFDFGIASAVPFNTTNYYDKAEAAGRMYLDVLSEKVQAVIR